MHYSIIVYMDWFLAHKIGLQQLFVIQQWTQQSERPELKFCRTVAMLVWMSYNPSEPQFPHLQEEEKNIDVLSVV